ncbi:MAG: ArsR family transcriptional regulator [Candidatus Heimdallarchaeota archaeon]|nr:ArsR family transcriptional regulator [Candidatus Heimdallarchaeota archaeon]
MESLKVDKSLKSMLQLKRSETRLQVLDLLMSSEEPMTSSDLASKLNTTENAINVALHYLTKAKLVQRVERGVYDLNVKTFCKALLAIILSADFSKLARKYDKTIDSLKDEEE